MYVAKIKFVSHAVALIIVAVVMLVGCSSSDPDPDTASDDGTENTNTDSETGETGTQTTETGTTDTGNTGTMTSELTTEFDGTWRSDCVKLRFDNIPEETQPDGYIQRTLTIDSATNAYSRTANEYTDSQCMLEDPEHTVFVFTGEIKFDGIVTTSSGMDATVARYFSDNDSPDIVGLLYRDGDILYLEEAQSGIIDDSIPTALNLSFPWRLVN